LNHVSGSAINTLRYLSIIVLWAEYDMAAACRGVASCSD
jgi:hypothetical protein